MMTRHHHELPNDPGWSGMRYASQRADGRIVCTVCPRRCALKDGQRGFCFVRQRDGAGIRLTTWGRSSGFCIDPVEKKPLFHYRPGSPVLSFGTAGCNLACRFCQNWDISHARDMDRLADEARPDAIAAAAASHDCSAVAVTYNDPTIFTEYAIDVGDACHRQGIGLIAVTAGFIEPAARQDLYAVVDAANVDLKAFDDGFYKRQTGSSLAPVLDTLRHLVHEAGVWTEITTLLIPGLNDDDERIRAECRWIADELGTQVPLHFSAFHPDGTMRDRPATPPSTLRRARAIAEDCGLQHVYVGNVHDPEAESTTCTGCGSLLIGRDHYELTAWGLDREGACRICRQPLAGVFHAQPGAWGRRRLPVGIGR